MLHLEGKGMTLVPWRESNEFLGRKEQQRARYMKTLMGTGVSEMSTAFLGILLRYLVAVSAGGGVSVAIINVPGGW
jgi:hypothetical protein